MLENCKIMSGYTSAAAKMGLPTFPPRAQTNTEICLSLFHIPGTYQSKCMHMPRVKFDETLGFVLMMSSLSEFFNGLAGLRGKFTGNPYIWWENLWFPVDFRYTKPWIFLGELASRWPPGQARTFVPGITFWSVATTSKQSKRIIACGSCGYDSHQ